MDISYSQIIDDKKIDRDARLKDLDKLKKWKATENERKFCGNNYLYHYQLENLLETRVGKKSVLREMMEDPKKKEKLLSDVAKRQRTGTLANKIFECYRVNTGSVVFFKPSTAKFLYKKFEATHVLDFTAGWGGRMLGAWSLDIAYTGIDTNQKLKPAYDEMILELQKDNLKMIWDSCLNVDLSEINYDFVLTSPPYVNLEIYEGMTPFESNKMFYNDFLIPMIERCRKHIKRGGSVAINISPKMYSDLLKFGYEPCRDTYDLLQQKRKGINKEDKIYIW